MIYAITPRLTGFLKKIFLLFIFLSFLFAISKLPTYFGLKSLCKDCNVIIVSLDTLSANHLQCYGYYRDTAPNLCSFAENNLFFKNAYSNASWTLPSDISLLSGLYPSSINLYKASDTLPQNIQILPQVLKDNGYETMFFAPRGDVAYPIEGIYDRIANNFYDDNKYSWADSINMFEESVTKGNKTFMFLHSYDVHEPFLLDEEKQIYEPATSKFPRTLPEFNANFTITNKFAEQVVSDIKRGDIDNNYCWSSKKDLAENYLERLLSVDPDYKKQFPILLEMQKDGLFDCKYQLEQKYLNNINGPEDVAALIALYDQTINILDKNKIPLLINLISNEKYKNNTILIILSEHGEEFMEHGHMWHETIYNPNTKIPLILSIPEVKKKTITKPVQLADLAPTIYSILGIKNSTRFDGINLIKEIVGKDLTNHLIVIDGWNFESKAIIYKSWKLYLENNINNLSPYELYNLSSDPGETQNVLFQNERITNIILGKYKALRRIN